MNISLYFGLASDLLVISILIAASFFDIKERRIPDRLIIYGIAAGVLLTAMDQARELSRSLAASITIGLLMLILFYMSKGGIGLGDVKLFCCTGFFLDFTDSISVMLTAAVLSGLLSLILLCMNRENRKLEIPFAPFIMTAAIINIAL